ncbi:MAG: class I SAM-dependent methyltransferase, partial [Natronomonas sp.]
MKGQEWYQADDIAEEYDDKRFSQGGQYIDRRESEAVFEALSPFEDKHILEVACGTGRFTVRIAERGANIVGVDISAAMLEQGRTKAQTTGVESTIEFILGDAARLPFPDDHFDSVFAMRFFHLADDPVTFMRELRRVASNQVFFDTFNRYSARSVYNWLLPMGSRLYSEREVRELLLEADLELADASHDFVVPYGFYRSIPGWIARPVRAGDTKIGRTPIGDRIATVSYWDAR